MSELLNVKINPEHFLGEQKTTTNLGKAEKSPEGNFKRQILTEREHLHNAALKNELSSTKVSENDTMD